MCACAYARTPACLCLRVALPPAAACMWSLHQLSWAPLSFLQFTQVSGSGGSVVCFLQSLQASLACIASSSPCILSVFLLSHKDRNAKGWARQTLWNPDNGRAHGEQAPWHFLQQGQAEGLDCFKKAPCHPTLSPLLHLSPCPLS